MKINTQIESASLLARAKRILDYIKWNCLFSILVSDTVAIVLLTERFAKRLGCWPFWL